MINKNFNVLVSQLKEKLDIESAIINKYGIVLESILKQFPKDSMVPQKILDLIQERDAIADSLKVDTIESLVIGTVNFYFLFTISKDIILISKLDLDKDLAKFIPNISRFLQNFIEKIYGFEKPEFARFSFSKEIEDMEQSINNDQPYEGKYSIVKELVKYISKL